MHSRQKEAAGGNYRWGQQSGSVYLGDQKLLVEVPRVRNLATAKQALSNMRAELKLLNQSALRSLDEGPEETLTLHRLGVFQELG
ncbi:hypothetical protein IIA28_15445, partial [candidate division KSB1 bacterium]|nr:hypothetical protein [candidate division KSB1 bacterium]